MPTLYEPNVVSASKNEIPGVDYRRMSHVHGGNALITRIYSWLARSRPPSTSLYLLLSPVRLVTAHLREPLCLLRPLSNLTSLRPAPRSRELRSALLARSVPARISEKKGRFNWLQDTFAKTTLTNSHLSWSFCIAVKSRKFGTYSSCHKKKADEGESFSSQSHVMHVLSVRMWYFCLARCSRRPHIHQDLQRLTVILLTGEEDSREMGSMGWYEWWYDWD